MQSLNDEKAVGLCPVLENVNGYMEESCIDLEFVPESNSVLKELERIAERNKIKQVTLCFALPMARFSFSKQDFSVFMLEAYSSINRVC